MELTSNINTLTITGNMKTVQDFQSIKNELDKMAENQKNIAINIIDSLSITSSIIGYLNKLVLKDGIKLSLSIGNDQLIELLDDLSLTQTFNVKKA